MAEVVANIRLEYGPNEIKLYRTDTLGDPTPFTTGTIDNLSFNIERIDDPTQNESAFMADLSGDLTAIKVSLDLGDTAVKAKLFKSTDNVYNPKGDEFYHIYSLVDANVKTLMAGKVHIYELAGGN